MNRNRILTMRFFLVMLLSLVMVVTVSAQGLMNKKVTINAKTVSAETVLNDLRKQTGMNIVYSSELAKTWNKISVNVSNKPAREVLEQVIGLIGCQYEMKGDVVTITRQQLSGKKRFVKGVVRDAEGAPLVGVPVCIGETRVCTVTDEKGAYSFEIPTEKTTLKFSYVGMDDQYVVIPAGNANVTKMITMSNGAALEDVVVTGYYNQAKNSFTGAARTITQEELQAGGNQNILSSLKNIDPSFVMVENTAMGSNPNAIPDFQIRGTGSINMRDTYSGNPNMPVFIVDGFETTAEKVFDMDPYRVKSITLLKDAASTAIYGSRASNGVVVITTNTPTKGRLAVSYNADITFNVPDLTSYNLCNAQQKLDLEVLAGLYDVDKKQYFNEDHYSDDWYYKQAYALRKLNIEQGINTDWLAQPLDEVVAGHKHSVRVDGGTDNFRYALDLNYGNTPGVMKKSGRERMGIGLEMQYTYKNITFRDQLTYSNVNSKNSPYGEFSEYAKLNPYVRMKDENGNYLYRIDDVEDRNPGQHSYVYNPLYNTRLNVKDETSYDDLTNLFGIDWSIIEGLRLKGTFSFTRQHTATDVFKPGMHTDFAELTGDDYERRGSYKASRGDSFSYDGSLVLSYFTQMDKHVINANLGWNIQQEQNTTFSVKAEGFPNDNLDYISFGTQYEKGGSPSGDEYTSRLVGFLGNVNYSYDERYLLDLSFREDASSRFGAKKRWAPFWSAGLGWNVHNEKFMEATSSWLNELKIRGTYGMTGSQEYDPYQAITTYQYLTSNRYHYGVGAVLMGMGNEDLTWQRTNQTNLGIDLAMLKNRIELSFDYYVKTSKDVLTAVTLPPSLGFSTYMANLGEVENKGFEISARAKILQMPEKRLYWSVNGSIVHNKNKLLKISESLRAYNEKQDMSMSEEGEAEGTFAKSTSAPRVRFVEGASINSIWVNKSLGVDPKTGMEIFENKDGSVTTEWKTDNYVIGGCKDPDYEGNFGTTFSWQGWQLNAVFRYRIGGQMYNQTLVDKVQDADPRYNCDLRAFTERWQKPGDVSRFTGFVNELNGINELVVTRPTSRFVEDYNYLELSTLNLSYEFDNSLTKKWGIQRLKLLFYMNDVFHSSSVKIERGTSYPYARNFSFGMQVRF